MVLVALVLSLIWFAHTPAVPDTCSRLPASTGPFESLETCRVKLGGSANESKINSSAWLVENYLEVDYTTVSQRNQFITFAEHSLPSDGNLFFCVELSNLRELNTILKNKNRVTSISNKYKEILETLGQQLIKKWNLRDRTLKYSDYKSYQGAYANFVSKDRSLSEFEKDKSLAFDAANKLFSDYLVSNGLIAATEKPSDWFRGGIGFTADEANLAARVSRYLSSPNRLRVYSSREVQEVLTDVLQWEIRYRKDLFLELKGTDLMIRTKSDVVIPHLEVFEILRKTEDPVELKKALVEAFGGLDPAKTATLEKVLTPGVIERFQIYKSLIDTFSPALMMAERNIASLAPAEFGGMSADFAGLGALNLQGVAEALALSRGNVDDAIVLARASEVKVTQEFKKKVSSFKKIVGKYFPRLIDSGDDFVAFGESAMTLATKKRLLNELAELTQDSRKRIAFLAEGARKEDRNLIVAHGEAIEKDLRLILRGKMEPEKLTRLLFGIDMNSKDAGFGTVQVIVGKPQSVKLSPTEWNLIYESLGEAIQKQNTNPNDKNKTQYKQLNF